MLFEKQIVNIFRSQLYIRQDNPNGIFYFSAGDFPGLKAYPYSFPSSQGHTLAGWFYCYDGPVPGRLVVFEHGMGNGHRAYFREIEMLAKAGYLVFAYDHTGCMCSGGENMGGFSQSLHDLDDCIRALKAEKALEGRTIAVVGHSWGGFSTMNISALHPDLTHIVVISGFVSVERMLGQLLTGFMGRFAKSLYALEQAQNPDYVGYDGVETLKNTNAKVLLVYSADDKSVHKANHYDVLCSALKDRENIRFLLVDGKDHNPNYTLDAVAYKNEFFKAYSKAAKKKQLTTPEAQEAFMANYDWLRMTQQDEAVWKEILDTLRA